MKKNIITCFFLIPLLSVAQYFDYINRAEIFIVNKEYQKAFNEYISCVDLYHHLQVIDYYNLVLCASILNKKEIALQYLDSCLTSGYTLYDFRNTLSEHYLELNTLNDFRKKRYDSLMTEFESVKKKRPYLILMELENKDQSFLRAFNSNIEKDFYPVDSMYYSHGKRLVELIQHDSLPEKGIFIFGTNRIIIPWVLIRHYYGMVNIARHGFPNYYKPFYNKVLTDSTLFFELVKLIHQGYFNPQVLKDGLIYGQEKEQFGFTGISNFYIHNSVNGMIQEELSCIDTYSKDEIEFFNVNRKKIGLIDFNNEMLIINYLKNMEMVDTSYLIPFKFNYFKSEDTFDLTNAKARIKKTYFGYRVLFFNPEFSRWEIEKKLKRRDVIHYEKIF